MNLFATFYVIGNNYSFMVTATTLHLQNAFHFSLIAMAKNTTVLLQRLRSLMSNADYVSPAINAYIVPSGDVHMVSISCENLSNSLYFSLVNTDKFS